jgi:hypothetical protein
VIQFLRGVVYNLLKSFSRDGMAGYSINDILIEPPNDENFGTYIPILPWFWQIILLES